MKKTLIALLALSSLAMGVEEPTVYDAYILKKDDTGNKIQTLDSKRGQLWFNSNAATLSSWMVEFTLNKLNSGNLTVFSSAMGDSGQKNERYGLGVFSWYDQTGVTIGQDNAHKGGAENVLFPDSSKDNLPVTLRLAYDAESNKAYLYSLTTNVYTSCSTTVDYNLTSATLNGGNDQKGVSSFWTEAGGSSFTVHTVTDMSSLAGDNSAFVSYVTTPAVPEPTTATLSLLALAGLAARRRRK